jgi:stage II sporulation protein D
MRRARKRAIRGIGGVLAALLGASLAMTVSASQAGAETLPVTATGKFVVEMRGNGHGHGMSQYGARGAALAGLYYPQIAAFYYPGTALTTIPDGRIRVKISNAGSRVTVAGAADLTITGSTDALPSDGVLRYRLEAGTHTRLWLQKLDAAAGSTWTTVRMGLPNGTEFHRAGGGPARLYAPDGTSTAYFGYLRAVRNTPSGQAGGVTIVNRVGYDHYAAGVVPSEMPTSWPRPAVRAQAVAARTYGVYAVEHPQSADYDICDTTMCQVYGGQAHYDAAGNLVSTEYLPASLATSNQVLKYKGATIFSQFSASDGGWTVDGGQPYLSAQADQYDSVASGDPYLSYRTTFSVATLAKAFGLAKVSEIAVTKRDGNGVWNGRMLAGYVKGTDSLGQPKTVTMTGFEFAAALGLGTTWLRLLAA